MYPVTFSTYVTPIGLAAQQLEAERTSVYVRGLATVLIKLFQIVRPDIAYFDCDDELQVTLIGSLVQDLSVDVVLRFFPQTPPELHSG
jgi:pantoate--beta-alanine ligase